MIWVAFDCVHVILSVNILCYIVKESMIKRKRVSYLIRNML